MERLSNDALKQSLVDIPKLPGIYKMINHFGEVIYIGKAKSLKRRVDSYFSKSHLDLKTRVMVSHVSRVEYIMTHSENEALLLERQCIRQYQPKYNVLLKDDKHFPYIKVTKEPFPKIQVVREKKQDGSSYYGPYPSIGSTKQLRRLLYELFPLRDCSQKITLESSQPKCILLDLGKCLGPCIYKDVISQYSHEVRMLHLLLTGQSNKVQTKLKKKMRKLSDDLRYEEACKVRDKLLKVEQLTEKQTVSINDFRSIQVWTVSADKHHYYVLIQGIFGGQLLYQVGYPFERLQYQSIYEVLSQVIAGHFEKEDAVPQEILVSSTLQESMAVLMRQYQLSISVKVPLKGIKKRILERAQLNATMSLTRLNRVNSTQLGNKELLLDHMKRQLNLRNRPTIIWGFDISHLQGTSIVGSSVCFYEGNPDKSRYRLFHIRSVLGKSDDFRSIQETVSRRFQLAFDQKETLPDVILIDGGKVQLAFAINALTELGVAHIVDVIALAKKEEVLFKEDMGPIKLSKSDPVLQLFQHVRDESHRFAVTNHRKKRLKKMFSNALLTIKGMGKKRLHRLQLHYPSVSQLQKDTAVEISKKTGIPLSIIDEVVQII